MPTNSRPDLHAGGFRQLIRASVLPCLMASALAACVVVPVVDRPPPSSSCETRTNSMSLSVSEVHSVPIVCGQDRTCAAAAVASMIVVTGGSALVSGTIVLVGNTAHWLEYQGTCSDGYLARARNAFLAAIGQS